MTFIYSPHLYLEGKHFHADDEVKAAVNIWLRQHDIALYKSGVEKLVLWY